MTKTTKAILAGAAFAGLFAGTRRGIKALDLLPSLKTSFSAQDQSQDQDKKADKKVKEKHACKGQNSARQGRSVRRGTTAWQRQELLQGQGRLQNRRQKAPEEKALFRLTAKKLYRSNRGQGALSKRTPCPLERTGDNTCPQIDLTFTDYGIGIGLRAPHYDHILTRKPVWTGSKSFRKLHDESLFVALTTRISRRRAESARQKPGRRWPRSPTA